jgi:phosphoenolpyruvate carboxykinase (ATP)
MVLIGGTEYAGRDQEVDLQRHELSPAEARRLSMHCSANYGRDRDDVALFFGLSGTGKTTLSADRSGR